jgi:hypothetical protein
MDSQEIQTRKYSMFTLGTISFFIINTVVVVSLVLAIMKNS